VSRVAAIRRKGFILTGARMVNRSREEITFCAYFLHAAGFECSVTALCGALDAGAWGGLWDACISLSDGTVLWIDYDGGYYHTPERVENDISKTERKLAENARHRVLRVRANASSLPQSDEDGHSA